MSEGLYSISEYQDPADDIASSILALIDDDGSMDVLPLTEDDKEKCLAGVSPTIVEGNTASSHVEYPGEQVPGVEWDNATVVPVVPAFFVTPQPNDEQDNIVAQDQSIERIQQMYDLQLAELQKERTKVQQLVALETEQREREHQERSRRRRIRNMIVVLLCVTVVVVAAVVIALSKRTDCCTTFKSFNTTEELYEAVDRWLGGERTEGSELSKTYGYPIGMWDVSLIADFSHLFDACNAYGSYNSYFSCNPTFAHAVGGARFNDDISMWNVSNARNMSCMFQGATRFSQDLSQWDVSKVQDMSYMFFGATVFTNDLSGWDVSQVESMSHMFTGAAAFTKGGLSAWDVSSVGDFGGMFSGALSFNEDLSAWDVSNVKSMQYMFQEASNFDSDLSRWNVSQVETMSDMFAFAASFKGNLSKWDVSRVQSMDGMFYEASAFNSDLSTWNVSRLQSMPGMFSNANSFDQDLCAWGKRLGPAAFQGEYETLVFGAFKLSGCPNQGDPDLNATVPGPFCHSCT